MLGRNPFVDQLRGLSILAVLIGHSLRFGGFWVEVFPEWTQKPFIEGAYHGVTIFFVISGYLITQKFFSEDRLLRVDAARFYTQRVARILPPVLLLMACTCAFAIIILGAPWSAADLGRSALLFFQLDLLGMRKYIPHTNSALDPLWSLAIEETFYVLLPVLCIFLATKRNLALALITFAVSGLIARYLFGTSQLYAFAGTFDQLAIGGLAAILAPRLSNFMSASVARIMGAASIILLGIFWFCAPIYSPPTQTIIAITAACYLISSRYRNPTSSVVFRPLQMMGYLSYEIYLIHLPIMHAMSGTMLEWRIPFSIANFIPFALEIALVLTAAWIIESFFSQPINDFIRARWLPSTGDGPDKLRPAFESSSIQVGRPA
ncbi:peptidoglycan/LPS O-acetylase OafA/YrhL [Nitrobacteraceae bacterium AZCC 2161]